VTTRPRATTAGGTQTVMIFFVALSGFPVNHLRRTSPPINTKGVDNRGSKETIPLPGGPKRQLMNIARAKYSPPPINSQRQETAQTIKMRTIRIIGVSATESVPVKSCPCLRDSFRPSNAKMLMIKTTTMGNTLGVQYSTS